MFAKLRAAKENEKGFTLVELLVVIIIIGILAAVAIPAFLNQRQRANDAAVQSDVKNVATQVETALVEAPNAASVVVGTSSAGVATITVSGVTAITANLTNGVTVRTKGTGTSQNANGYVLYGAHTNGKQFKNAAVGTLVPGSVLSYDSANGGIKGAVTIVAADLL